MAILSKRWTPLCYSPFKKFCFKYCPIRNHQKIYKFKSVYVGKDTSCVHLLSLKTLSLISVSFENRNDYINFLHACPILEDLHAESIYFIKLNEKTASKEGLKPLTLVSTLSQCRDNGWSSV
ncbi:putative leucine-rich repeat 2 [Medicago truncatula]|uniref:Putative leucine-rich repeat 2 n=1 Tax=Medicago truncatula TaxID=3880 RepID=A0A396HC13_MEDTR|nr:putative leucine-rich repeat 2 [Medicago truncatula]